MELGTKDCKLVIILIFYCEDFSYFYIDSPSSQRKKNSSQIFKFFLKQASFAERETYSGDYILVISILKIPEQLFSNICYIRKKKKSLRREGAYVRAGR